MTEQIEGIESLSIDFFKFLVVPRVLACVVMPILTLIMDFSGLLAGFAAEYAASHISFQLYITPAFGSVDWANFIPPTFKTAVFGFLIGTVSSYFGCGGHRLMIGRHGERRWDKYRNRT